MNSLRWCLNQARTLLLLLLFLSIALSARSKEIDWGLPLFNQDEIRLEREKNPSFNISLFQKYHKENIKEPLSRLHAIHAFVRLILMSEEGKSRELKKTILENLRPPGFIEERNLKPDHFSPDQKAQILDYIFLVGLLLAQDKEPDPANKKDKEFEDLLLKAEEVLAEAPEYSLVKGILFSMVRDRPNGYFAPMKPLEDLKMAGARAPSDPSFQFVLGQAFRLLGKDEQYLFNSVVSYEKACALDPNNQKLQSTILGIYMGLHESYQGQKKNEPFWLEEVVYKKILSISPNNPYALNNLGYLYAEFGVHRAEALDLCQRAADQAPNNPGFRDSLGWAAFKNQQYDKAENELKKAISLNPDNYDSYYHLGTLYYVRKNVPKAIEMYEKAVRIKPEAAEALNNYAYLLAENDRDLDKAVQMAKKAVALEPGNPSYIDSLGWAEYKLGNFEEAGRYLRKAFQLTPDVGEILSHLGKYYIQIKQFDLGLSYLKQAQKADKNLENIQDDIFFAMNMSSVHQVLVDYHRAFGSESNPRHITAVLLQIARLYQDVGQFSQAIIVNQLCEKLRQGGLDLSKPLFDFYTIDIASAAVAIASAPSPALIESEEETNENQVGSSTTFPDIAPAAMALNVGPAVFRILGARLLPFRGFETLSATLFIRNIWRPYSSAILQLEIPDSASQKLLEAVSDNLAFFNCRSHPFEPSTGKNGFMTVFGRYPLWIEQKDDFLLLGSGQLLDEETGRKFFSTFPYHPDNAFGFLMNWLEASKAMPAILTPFIGNPLGEFSIIYSRYWREPGRIRELSLLLPAEPLSKEFMRQLADVLYFYKSVMLKFGCRSEIKVEATDDCLRFSIEYYGLGAFFRDIKQKFGFLGFFLKPKIDSIRCLFRRGLFNGHIQNLGLICPAGGSVTVNPSSGNLTCSFHHLFPLVFPLLGQSEDRCSYSRVRLLGLIHQFRLADKATEKIGDLIKKMLLDYNIPSCSKGGEYLFEGNEVKCTIHSPDTSEAGKEK